MSANYTCNQFDKAYKPTRLGNWEVPKWHINRPKGRSTVTKVIANDRGHLLPGVQKTDQKHWAGLYLGTYQLPKRISKDTAIELASPKCQTWMKRSYHHPFIDRGQRHKNGKDDKLEDIYAKERPDEANRDADRDSIKSVKSAITNAPPGNVSSSDGTVRNCASADGALNSTVADAGSRGAGASSSAGGTPSSPALSRISVGGEHHRREHRRDEHHRRREGGAAAEEPLDDARTPPAGGRGHGDAHRHHGLPDAIEDAVYRSLQTKRHKHPGLGLEDCWPKCSAVAYKSFNDPGPTQCSKLRVYRPKTSSPAGGKGGKEGEGGTSRHHRHRDGSPRPKTCVPVVTAQQLSDIKLALCWDLDAPLDRNRRPDEPAVFHKVRQQTQPRSPQGSAGSCAGAPSRKPQNSSAVMGFVRAPPAENGDVGGGGPAGVVNGGGAAGVGDDGATGDGGAGGDGVDSDVGRFVPESKRMQTRECLMKNRNLSAVMELIPNKENGNGNGNGRPRRRDDCCDRSPPPRNGCSDGGCDSPRGHRDNGDGTVGDGSSDGGRPRRRTSAECSSGGRRRSHRRHRRRAQRDDATDRERPQQRHSCRPCAACDHPDAVAAACAKHGDDERRYKMAFKAGVPVSTPVKHRAGPAPPAGRLRVPKPRTTNSDKKKYVIGTLLPPFSMWPGTTARDYPEHWRLTSVYRQAFKPLELRKQPLLQTVYL